MSDGRSLADDDDDLDDLLAARREKARRSGAGTRLVVGGLGLAVMAAGAGLWIGNMTGAFVTFPMAGYITIVFGSFLLWLARQYGQPN